MAINGYAGKILRVDLSNGRLSEETLSDGEMRKWVGGVGFGAKYLYDEVPPGVQWNDPGNRLIVASGPLAGTRMAGSGTICLCTRGCLTNGATSSQANGFMGAYMKFAGYDAIIFQGIAREWVYLYIHDGKAELKDARHLLGKTTWDLEDTIKEELGLREKEASVFGIGPAGENLVKFAGVFGDKDHAAGHNGIGAVMGAKKLKAFCAARGHAKVMVKNPERLARAVDVIWDDMENHPGMSNMTFRWGTGGNCDMGERRLATGTWPTKNYTTNLYPLEAARSMTNEYARSHWQHKANPCWACRTHHCSYLTITEGPYAGQTVEEPEYELWAACGPLIGNTDPAAAVMLAHRMTLLGLEGNEAGFLLAMVIDLYESGSLNSEKTDGLVLTWGNTTVISTLLERIALRQGKFASILAEGTALAAAALGEAALERGIYAMKGHSPRGHDHRSMWREMFDTAVSDIGTYSSGYFGAPHPDIPPVRSPFAASEVAAHTARAKGVRQFQDAVGVCAFTNEKVLDEGLDALNAVTGWEMTQREAQDVGFRATNLMRAFNLRHGITVASEQPSPRWSSTPVDGPAKGVSVRPSWDAMLDDYYKLMGWDRTSGRPLPETLLSLGLENVVKDLWDQPE